MNLRVITLCAIPLLISLTAFSQERVRSLRPKYTSQMTVTGYTGQETLTNFPVAVRISPSNIEGFNYNQCKGQEDISFSDANGMILPHEIECWNTNGESVAWVSLPTMTTNSPTTFTMNWKHSIEPECTSTSVWTNAKYLGVFHMNTPVAANTQTNSACGPNLTMVGASPSLQTSSKLPGTVLKNAIGQKTSADILTFPNIVASGINRPGFTLSGWSYWSGYKRDGAGYIMEVRNPTSSTYPWEYTVRYNNPGIKFGTATPTRFTEYLVYSGWFYWTIVVENKRTFKYYMNGAFRASKTVDNDKYVDNATTIHYQVGGTAGYTDEIRIHNVAASDDWVKAEYDAINNAEFIVAAPAVRRPDPLQFIIR